MGAKPTDAGFESRQVSKFINGGACTKAGVFPLQGKSGGFDFHRLHIKMFLLIF